MQQDLSAIFDDLCSRFLLNIPKEETVTLARICFQIENAHWFYEDFFRSRDPSLPKYNLRVFAAIMFRQTPTMKKHAQNVDKIINDFGKYKDKVPVCGAILLNETFDKCLMVKAWGNKVVTWGFPRGKINKDETEMRCAVREVLEEIGFNIEGRVQENDFLEGSVNGHKVKLFVIPGVPESTYFETQTRNEISKIEWHSISQIGKNPMYARVSSFVGDLKEWITQYKATNGTKNFHMARHRRLSDFFASDEPSEHLKRLLGLSLNAPADASCPAPSETPMPYAGEQETRDIFAPKPPFQLAPISPWTEFRFDHDAVQRALNF